VTKNKVTAIFSEKVDMSIDRSLLASAEAERLNGENVKSTTTNFLCGLNRPNSIDVSGLARSTNKVGTIILLGVMDFKSRK